MPLDRRIRSTVDSRTLYAVQRESPSNEEIKLDQATMPRHRSIVV